MRNFSARETVWLQELDGIELASFRARFFAFVIDSILTLMLTALLAYTVLTIAKGLGIHVPEHLNINYGGGHEKASEEGSGLRSELNHLLENIVTPILYFGLLTWHGKGRTPGKRLMKIRVVSIVHRHLTLWHSIERALGYGAAFLEGGFGFVQFFIHPYRRCVQDRIAETIVVTERSWRMKELAAARPAATLDASDEPSALPDRAEDQSSSITSST